VGVARIFRGGMKLFPTTSFAYIFLKKTESHPGRYVKIYKFPKSQKTEITVFAVFSDGLRRIQPKTDKMRELFICNLQSL